MILKAKDLIEKSEKELKEELENISKQIFQSKMELHSRKLENHSSIRELRKSRARILTILRQRSLEEQAS